MLYTDIKKNNHSSTFDQCLLLLFVNCPTLKIIIHIYIWTDEGTVTIHIFHNHKKIIGQISMAEAEVSEDMCENVFSLSYCQLLEQCQVHSSHWVNIG